MIEVGQFEDVTQIRMSREIDGTPLYWVAAYLVDGLLVDTGCSYTAGELASFLDDRDVRLVVNSHFHEDHVGCNHILQERFNLDIFAHPDSIPLIGKKVELFPYQETVWGYPVPTKVMPLPEYIRTERYRFDVMETPGHSAGHVALVEMNEGWCFSADIFARETMKFIRPEEDMELTIQSMKRLIDLDTERLVLFTSVGKIVADGRRVLGASIEYLETLADKVHRLRKEGRSVDEIIWELFGGEHPFAELTNGQYTTENLVRSLLKIKDGQS